MPSNPVHRIIHLGVGGQIRILAPDPTARDDDGDWPQPHWSDAYVSATGKYCCETCEVILKPTTEPADDFTWQRYLWWCPECETTIQI